MSQHSTIRHATGNLSIRIVIWLLALVAAAGAVFSVDRVLRNRSADGDASVPVILPAPSGGDSAAKAVESAAKTVAALSGAVSDEPKRDSVGSDDDLPAFDVVRVEPSGDTVIAGRATPGAMVELLRNGRVHDRVAVDASGQFALVPPKLPAGDSELTLRSKPRNGAAVVSKQTVVVSVQPNLKDQPVVALMTPDKPSVILSKPAAPDAATDSVVVEAVEAEAGGSKLYVTGHSKPGALVRLYLDDNYQSTATADGSGRIAFTAPVDSSGHGGEYQVRLDEVDRASGVITSRAEVSFMPPKVVAAAAAVTTDGNPGASAGAGAANNAGASASTELSGARASKENSMVVSRGDSLWRISRFAYGDGARYTVIYDANHKQIRNPNRIYPGQVFIIPKGR
jgi:hypothetical protein